MNEEKYCIKCFNKTTAEDKCPKCGVELVHNVTFWYKSEMLELGKNFKKGKENNPDCTGSCGCGGH